MYDDYVLRSLVQAFEMRCRLSAKLLQRSSGMNSKRSVESAAIKANNVARLYCIRYATRRQDPSFSVWTASKTIC